MRIDIEKRHQEAVRKEYNKNKAKQEAYFNKIGCLSEKEFEKKLDKIPETLKTIKKHNQQVRAFLIALYYTGADGRELLELKSNHITQKGYYVRIDLDNEENRKRKSRTLSLDKRKYPLVKELYNFAITSFPNYYLFFDYRKSGSRYIIKQLFGEDINLTFFRKNREYLLKQEGRKPKYVKEFLGMKTLEEQYPEAMSKYLSKYNK